MIDHTREIFSSFYKLFICDTDIVYMNNLFVNLHYSFCFFYLMAPINFQTGESSGIYGYV